MEQTEHEPAPFEREPQVADVVAAFKHVIAEMAPHIEAEELADLVSEIEDSDAEDAMGAVVGAFVVAGLDDNEGLRRITEILQIQAILPNGDRVQKPQE